MSRLGPTGLTQLLTDIKTWVLSKIPTKTSQLTNDSNFLTSHQSLSNYVTLNSAQTITKQKTFTVQPAVKNTTFELGATPSSNQVAWVAFFDKNNVQSGWVGRAAYTNGYDTTTLSCSNKFTNGAKATDGTNTTATLEIGLNPAGVAYLNTNAGWMSTLKPMTTLGADLGTSGVYWSKAYVNNYYGTSGSFSYGIDCGCIELNAASGRSDGGYIDFHYNQSSADFTSRIIESVSGILDINGVKIPNGTGKIHTQTSLVKGTNPSAQTWIGLYFNDKTYANNATHRIAAIEPCVNTNGTTSCYMRAYNWVASNSSQACIAVHYPVNGTGYTEAPTPATSDNSTKIATTAFVKAQGYLTSHQSLSNYVTLNGTQTITGAKTISTNLKFQTTLTRGTAPSSTDSRYFANYVDSAGNNISLISSLYNKDKSSVTRIYAYNTTAATGDNIGYIGIGCDASGNVYTQAPTPGAGDDSTKIPTTKWINAYTPILAWASRSAITDAGNGHYKRTSGNSLFCGYFANNIFNSTSIAPPGIKKTGTYELYGEVSPASGSTGSDKIFGMWRRIA